MTMAEALLKENDLLRLASTRWTELGKFFNFKRAFSSIALELSTPIKRRPETSDVDSASGKSNDPVESELIHLVKAIVNENNSVKNQLANKKPNPSDFNHLFLKTLKSWL